MLLVEEMWTQPCRLVPSDSRLPRHDHAAVRRRSLQVQVTEHWDRLWDIEIEFADPWFQTWLVLRL